MARRTAALTSLIIAAFAAAGLTSATAADAPPASDRPMTTSMQVPLAGTVPGACQGDQVSLSGELNAVTRVRVMPKLNTLDVFLSLHNVKGVGSVSGLKYLGLGTAQFTTEANSGVPKLQPTRANFMLWGVGRPPNACVGEPNQVQPLPVTVTFTFDAEGALVGAEAKILAPGR